MFLLSEVWVGELMTAVERAEPSRAEPSWMGCKQGVRGALLEAAGLSLPAVPLQSGFASATLLQFITAKQQQAKWKELPRRRGRRSASYQYHVHRYDCVRINSRAESSLSARPSQLHSDFKMIKFQVVFREHRTKWLHSCCSYAARVIKLLQRSRFH